MYVQFTSCVYGDCKSWQTSLRTKSLKWWSLSKVNFEPCTFFIVRKWYEISCKRLWLDIIRRWYLHSFENVSSIEKHIGLNADFNSLYEWFIDNKLSIYFEEDKTKFIFSKKKRNSNPLWTSLETKKNHKIFCSWILRISGKSMAKRALKN